MEGIRSYEEYSGELRAYRAQARESGVRLCTNCYFLRAGVERLTAESRLFLHRQDKNLYILEDGGTFYRLYYYAQELERVRPLPLGKPVVLEFPFNSALTEEQMREIAFILRLGLRLGRESVLRTGSEVSARMDPVALPEGYRMVSAQREHAKDILSLFTDCFDPLYAFLPTLEQLQERIKAGCVFAVLNGSVLAGALNGHRERSVAVCDHVAIASSYRGIGLGKALLACHHRRYQGQVREYRAWTDRNNKAAMGMYTSMGYNSGADAVRAANEYIGPENR